MKSDPTDDAKLGFSNKSTPINTFPEQESFQERISLQKPMPTMTRGRFVKILASAVGGSLITGGFIDKLFTKPEYKEETKYPFVFHLDQEVDAMIHNQNHTTLTHEEKDHFTKVVDAFDEITKAQTDKSSPELGRLHLAKAFEAINNLPKEEQRPVLGRLIYHNAHHHEKRILLAYILTNFPDAKNDIGFVGGSPLNPDSTPIDFSKPAGIGNLLRYGRYFSDAQGNDFGKKYKIFAWDEEELTKLNNDVAEFTKAKARLNR